MSEISDIMGLHTTYQGMRIVQSGHLEKEESDLSVFRFLSFHKSKLKRNRPNKVMKPFAYQHGSTLYIHPKLYRDLQLKLAEDLEQRSDQMMYSALRGSTGA